MALCSSLCVLGTNLVFAQSTEENAASAMDELSNMEAGQSTTPAPQTKTSTTVQETKKVEEAKEAVVEPAPTKEAPAAKEDTTTSSTAETKKTEIPPAPDANQPAASSDAKASSGTVVKSDASAKKGGKAGMIYDPTHPDADANGYVSTKPAKPWRINLGLSQSLGAGAFVSDKFARTTSYGYRVSFGGSYKLSNMFRGSVGGSFDQNLTTTYNDLGTVPRQFFFRDIRFGVRTSTFYKEKITGITVSASGFFTLPTSKPSISTGRITLAGATGIFIRNFANVGPGNLTLIFTSGFSGALGAATPKISPTDAPSIFNSCNDFTLSGDACQTQNPNLAYNFANRFIAAYSFLKKFNLTGWFGFSNSVFRDITDSPLDAIEYDVRESDFAVDQAQRFDTVNSGLELGYGVNNNISLALGASTVMNPFIQRGDNQWGLRFVLWDTETTSNNLSSLYFNINYLY